MSDDQIKTRQGSIPGKTMDALKGVLEAAGLHIQNVHIYLPHNRQNGVFWVAVGAHDGEVIAIHGMSIAGTSVRNGMVITRHEGTLWQALANRTRSRGKSAKVDYGNAIDWAAEPMVDRLAKCVESLIGHDLVSEATADKLRKKITAMKEGQR